MAVVGRALQRGFLATLTLALTEAMRDRWIFFLMILLLMGRSTVHYRTVVYG
ncbi:hypothetical protein ACLF3G_28330 [Falsiroseomonas sp. HC035]|uniref:hypothetical protein n=1 Tax=Falsiroseomonas sp. HC035 TaxID=3390999 RepID=UPI003D31DE90